MALPDLTDLFVADTYKGVLHSANIPITNLPPIYDGLGNKSSLKLGSDGNGASISGCLSADCLQVAGADLVDYVFPIGSIFFSADNVNPGVRFVGTTWSQISQGRFIVGVGTGNDETEEKIIVAGNNTGKYNHTLTESEIPEHRHDFISTTGNTFFVLADNVSTLPSAAETAAGEFRGQGPNDNDDCRYYPYTGYTGGGSPHNNTPPGFGLYVWQRIS